LEDIEVFYFWVVTAVLGLAATVLGFFMLGWRDPRGLSTGGPYVVFGILALPFAQHIGPVSQWWSVLLYVVGAFQILFGLGVVTFDQLGKAWFVLRYLILGVFWLVMSVVIPEVTSSMRIFPVFMGLAYISIALATLNAERLTGGYVGPDVALNGMCFLFLGILLTSVPDFFTNPGPSIWLPGG
jgi:hypothetical protein